MVAGWLQGNPPLLELRRRRGLKRDLVVDGLVRLLGLDPGKRERVARYYDELETGLLDASRVDSASAGRGRLPPRRCVSRSAGCSSAARRAGVGRGRPPLSRRAMTDVARREHVIGMILELALREGKVLLPADGSLRRTSGSLAVELNGLVISEGQPLSTSSTRQSALDELASTV